MESNSDIQKNILTDNHQKENELSQECTHTKTTSLVKYKSKENIKNGSIPVRYHSYNYIANIYRNHKMRNLKSKQYGEHKHNNPSVKERVMCK